MKYEEKPEQLCPNCSVPAEGVFAGGSTRATGTGGAGQGEKTTERIYRFECFECGYQWTDRAP